MAATDISNWEFVRSAPPAIQEGWVSLKNPNVVTNVVTWAEIAGRSLPSKPPTAVPVLRRRYRRPAVNTAPREGGHASTSLPADPSGAPCVERFADSPLSTLNRSWAVKRHTPVLRSSAWLYARRHVKHLRENRRISRILRAQKQRADQRSNAGLPTPPKDARKKMPTETKSEWKKRRSEERATRKRDIENSRLLRKSQKQGRKKALHRGPKVKKRPAGRRPSVSSILGR